MVRMARILVPVSKGPIPRPDLKSAWGSRICFPKTSGRVCDSREHSVQGFTKIEKNHLPKQQAPKEKLARSKLTAGRRHRLSTEPTRTSLTKPGPNKPELSGASIEWRSQPLDKHGQNSGSTGAIRGALTQAQKVMVLLQVARILGGGLSLAFQLAQRSC